MTQVEVLIIGAGAAGLFCAGVAAQQGLQVLVLDHSEKVAEKIRISGGGRSNFTNSDIDPRTPHKHFLGENPQFARSALSRYNAADFVALVQKHGIAFHEKHKGQLFCDRSAQDLIDMLLRECEAGAMGGAVTRWQPCSLQSLQFSDAASHAYTAQTSQGEVQAKAVVVASGGLSIPKIGATDLGYRCITVADACAASEAHLQQPALDMLGVEGGMFGPVLSSAAAVALIQTHPTTP
jgi:predicted Rossmann fold flavoprotein